MGFIQNENQPLIWIRRVVLSCRAKDLPLDRTQKHVLKHRVVCDQEIGQTLVHFLAKEQFRIIGPLDSPDPVISVLPSALAVPRGHAILPPRSTRGP